MLLNLAVFQRLSSGNILASENRACCLSYLHCRLQLRELEFSQYFVYSSQRFGKNCSSGVKFLFPTVTNVAFHHPLLELRHFPVYLNRC